MFNSNTDIPCTTFVLLLTSAFCITSFQKGSLLVYIFGHIYLKKRANHSKKKYKSLEKSANHSKKVQITRKKRKSI